MNEERLQRIEQEIKTIGERNARVEADKAWETSLFRMVSLAVVTYLAVAVLLYFIGVPNFFLASLVPAAGFVLSVQSLPMIKRWWIGRHLRK